MGKVLFFDASELFGKDEKVLKLPDGMIVTLETDNPQRFDPNTGLHGITLHWSAGTYTQIFDGYAYCITRNVKNGNIWIIKCLKTNQKGFHLWGRNGQHMGVSFMACRGASAKWMGQYPITPEMAEAAWELIAEICIDLKIDPSASVSEQKMESNDTKIWAVDGKIEMPTISDHAAFAIKDGYSSYRWDIGDFFPEYANKVQWYHTEMLKSPQKRLYVDKLK